MSTAAEDYCCICSQRLGLQRFWCNNFGPMCFKCCNAQAKPSELSSYLSDEKCPKCGGKDYKIAYLTAEGGKYINSIWTYLNEEQLLITCERCCFNWLKPTLDNLNKKSV